MNKRTSQFSEDLLAILVSVILLTICWFTTSVQGDRGRPGAATSKVIADAWLKSYVSTPGKWESNPLDALVTRTKEGAFAGVHFGVLGVCIIGLAVFAVAARASGESSLRFLAGFVPVVLLNLTAFIMSSQSAIQQLGIEYAIWALLLGLMISNLAGTPAWMQPAIKTELYLKAGLVLMGATILISKLLALGVPGIFVSWVVTPIVLVTTFWFGQRVLKLESATLNMVISADMSVCGTSAAIATAAAVGAKKEELTTAIGLSMAFTLIMMFVMPAVIRGLGIDPVLGGAWMGGTIDSTGAVAAAGAMLGDAARDVAITIKMIQNVMIGAIAFVVSLYWVTRMSPSVEIRRSNPSEVWKRFPKFILGFLGASIVFSLIYQYAPYGQLRVDAMVNGPIKTLQTWFFGLAFVSIGLETNFRQISKNLAGGKPLILYVCGQTLNLALTFVMAWLMFQVVFPHATDVLRN